MSEVIFGIDYLVADLARHITLMPGDLILTGVGADQKPSHFCGQCRPETEPGEQPTLLLFCAAEDEE